jgi:glycosyltransferase involved in cell wall biosynthesis
MNMARFGFLSTYPPTRCGLATFTESLAGSMVLPSDDAFIVRVMDESSPIAAHRKRGLPVSHMLNGDPASITAAVRMLNTADVAVIQHEYGIYGGPDGDEVLAVLSRLDVPAVVVLHTVLAHPTAGQKRVLEEVARLASAVVVMSETARGNLTSRYNVDGSAVRVIPHGVHPLDNFAPLPHPDRPIVLTWGLIGPGKGIEWAIQAFGELRDLTPRPRYRVLGQTHPKVLANDGDAYRDRLVATVDALGLGSSITIDGRYLNPEALARNILVADIVLLPYDSRIQVTSGVLAEAVAAGKPVVATAFPHAKELLATGAGIVVPHEDPSAIAAALRTILTDPDAAARMARIARRVGRETTWPEVGQRFRTLALRLRSTVAA